MKNYRNHFRSLGTFSLALVIALSMIVVAGNYSASQSSGTSVTTCYNKKSGALRYLVKGTCKKTETKLSIGQVGPQGPAGASGATGSAGAAGPAGTPGYSSGLSVTDLHDDSDPSYRPTVPISDTSLSFSPTLVFRTDDISTSGAKSSDLLALTDYKLVQISASLVFLQVSDIDTVK
jgi:hypothetical protein